MQILFLVFLFVVGACFGSFLCCQARRLHLKTTKSPSLTTINSNRSVCLHCEHQLKWYDNLPIISWLALRGKCRHCHKRIGKLEILSEIGVALSFLLLGNNINLETSTPLEWAIFIVILLLTLSLSFLAIYDGAYGELPTIFLIISLVIAVIVLILKTWNLLLIVPFSPNIITDPLISFLILGGLYLILYLISKGKWVGDGDWLLATAIAMALASPWLALITLTLANFTACLIMLLFQRKHLRHLKIHFGPFLVAAFVVTASFAKFFINMI